jgi:predicted HicB family RNase H-like nuclease
MTTDVVESIFNTIDEIEAKLHGCVRKAENAVKRNSQLHLMINSGLLEKMRQKAENNGISLSEWCRRKLSEDSQLDRIERKLDFLIENYIK